MKEIELTNSRKPIILKLALVVVILVFLGNAVFIRRDYQDSWVLEGLELPFVLFLFTYVIVFFSEKKISWMIALAVIGRIVFLLVPNLKYVWFQGPWIDQHRPYALAGYVVDQGHIIHGVEAFGAKVYSGTPLMHLAFSNFSVVLDIALVDAIKYLPVILSVLYPLLIYTVTNKMKLPFKSLKYAVFISSIPLGYMAGQYLVSGLMFGTLLTFLVVSLFAMLMPEKDRRYLLILIFLIFVLAATHSSSSVLLTALLLATMLVQEVRHFRIESHTKSLLLLIATVCVAWLAFLAPFTLEAILRVFVFRVPAGTTPRAGALPDRFLEVARKDMFSAVLTILVKYGADILLLLLTLAGLVVLFKYRKQANKITKFFSIFAMWILVFMVAGFILKVGAFRPLSLISIMFPIFSAVFILHVSRRKKWISRVTFVIMLLLATLQLYSCQPLVPSANVLFPDLPIDEPLFYVTNVNSVYQRNMIFFAKDHIANGRIACDRITRNQIAGLAGFDYWVSHVIDYYPIDKNEPDREYEFFMIHLPGISGRFQEPVEIRTEGLILSTIYNSSVIYTNGQSYILTDN